MKWKNKGHEFDDTYEEMCKKDSYYLFGAGDYGRLFYEAMRDEISILGFIDNNIIKQQKGCLDERVYPVDDVLDGLEKNVGVILTISQFSRPSAKRLLEQIGLKENSDYFLFEDFISIYHVYKYNKVYMSTISFLPSTFCNLKCRHCLNFNPFAKHFYRRDYSDLVKDIDLFFNKIEHVMIFHLSGGEPMLYPDIYNIIRYIDSRYGNQIDRFRTVTNGTVIPGEQTLEALAESKVEVTIDDYRETVPQYAKNFAELVRLFDEYQINYVINKATSWVDLAPEKTNYSNRTEEWLIDHFDDCCQTWHELRDGKIYMCNYASYAQVAGLSKESTEEAYPLCECTEQTKKELIEFRLGYSEKGYTEFCKKCRGFTVENKENVFPAVQV